MSVPLFFAAAFLACAVEMVAALTIVLGIGSYPKRLSRSAARLRRRLFSEFGFEYTVPGSRQDKGKGPLWDYMIPNAHPWVVEALDAYVSEWERVHADTVPSEFYPEAAGDF